MPAARPFHPVQALLTVSGVLLVVASVVFNELLIGRFDPSPPLAAATRAAIRQGQLVWATAGLALLGGALLLGRVPALARATGRNGAALATLLVLGLAIPFGLAEFALRPWFVPARTTTLFERDVDLGWRHRRGAVAEWQGVRVQLNRDGLRGPGIRQPKPPGVVRILWLGDSVTFGDKIAADTVIFPERVARLLMPRDAVEVESINAGVSGYSTWQHLRYLQTEGLRLTPDLVVVGFVLNDVTEFLELTRFGGSWEGWQLWYTRSRLQHALGQSAVVHFLGRALLRLRFGSDPPVVARDQEVLSVRSLIDEPDRAEVRRAWDKTLRDLDELVALARSADVPLAVVVFPFRFQVEEPTDQPAAQRLVAEFAAAADVPALDLLPRFLECLATGADSAGDFFIDHVHLTPRGHLVASRAIAAFLAESGSLPVTGPRLEEDCGA